MRLTRDWRRHATPALGTSAMSLWPQLAPISFRTQTGWRDWWRASMIPLSAWPGGEGARGRVGFGSSWLRGQVANVLSLSRRQALRLLSLIHENKEDSGNRE